MHVHVRVRAPKVEERFMPYSYPISVVVGSAGATIVATDGFEFVIPEDALSRDTTITIAAPVTATNVSTLTEVSRAWTIGPLGTTFDIDATVFIPYFSSYESQRGSIYVYMADSVTEPDPAGWTQTPRDTSKSAKMGGTISSIQCAMAAIPQ